MVTNQDESDPSESIDTIDRIMAHHAKFLSFLASRVEDKAAAEDILQSAFIKAIEHGSEIRDDESTVAWFYRILRNAITDHYRKGSARTRAHDTYTAELPISYEPETAQTVCACI
jgi:RNA polymerase sigma-70 factor, ECF subfamily